MITIIDTPNGKAVTTTSAINEDTQTISELWESVAKLANARVEDNQKSDAYPLHIRNHQLSTLQVLVNTLHETHDKMNNIVIKETLKNTKT